MKHSIALVLVLFAACVSSSSSSSEREPASRPATRAARSELGPLFPEREPCAGIAELMVWHRGVQIGGVDQMLRLEDGKLSVETLRDVIAPDDVDAPCADVVEIGASADATYADLVAVMEAARAAGRTDVGVVGGSSAMYPDPPRPKQPTDQEFIDALAKPPYDIANVPRLRITESSMRVEIAKHETVIDDVPPLGDAAAMQGLHETLREAREALPATEQPMLLLQADRAVSAKLVIDATGSARAAGYDQVLFAI
jgi:biopolymer transport protein ExbD